MKIRLGLGACKMSELALYCGGELVGNINTEFEYVCTDSREADEKTLFIATRGERVDGHNYIGAAQRLGCICFLCERVPEGVALDGSTFCVAENSLDGFSHLARGYRESAPLDCVAITGSVGKTTTKELTARVMSEGYNLYSTEGNFNSVIGMPMSMLEVGPECEAAVFEMGMSGFGEISQMSLTARPRVAMITNIGTSHLEYLKTRENIARAKYEISEGLRDGGVLILNGDEPLLRELANKDTTDRYSILYASMNGDGDFSAENVRFTEQGSVFDVKHEGGVIKDIYVSAIGSHIVFDALFAAAAGLTFGLTPEQIKAGLSKYVPGAFRQKIYDKNGVKVIADCYNASPESMRSALGVLTCLEGKRKIAVLGDMRELGESAHQLHVQIGQAVAENKIDVLVALGELGGKIAKGALACGMDSASVFCETDTAYAETVKYLGETLREGDVVLFKASRAMRLESIIEGLSL